MSCLVLSCLVTSDLGQAQAAALVRGAESGKKTVLLSHLYIKMLILPRQARDKHRENSKIDRFLAALLRD
eukprot:SAG22_NODE_11306_length_491_cov_0.788265_1_plen_69_part_01